MYTLVVTSHSGQLERVVGHRGHCIVCQTLVGGVSNVVEHDENNGPSGGGNRPVPRSVVTAPIEGNLETEAATPDGDEEQRHDGAANERSYATLERESIEYHTDKDGSNNTSETREQRHKRTRASIEEEGSDGALVGVKVIAAED